MNQGSLSNSAYRITKKKNNNNLNNDYLPSEEDVFKMSIHSSAQMTPGKRKRNVSQGIRYT